MILDTNARTEPDLFVEREACISCGSANLRTLSGGAFTDQPLNSFISNDPWGESPMSRIANERWEFVRCSQCSQKFHKRIIAPEWDDVLFSKWMSREAIEEFEERIGADTPRRNFEKARQLTKHVYRLERLTASLRRENRMRIMDFGCGWGDFLAIAKRYGVETYGIDADPDRRESGIQKDIGVVADLAEIDPELMGKIHVITLFQVLEHLRSPLSVLEELAEWVMPNGILILATPDCSGVLDIKTMADYRAINPLSHINAFTPKSLAELAKRAGFRPIFPGVAHATTSPLQVIKTEIGRQIGRFLPATTDQYFRRS